MSQCLLLLPRVLANMQDMQSLLYYSCSGYHLQNAVTFFHFFFLTFRVKPTLRPKKKKKSLTEEHENHMELLCTEISAVTRPNSFSTFPCVDTYTLYFFF